MSNKIGAIVTTLTPQEATFDSDVKSRIVLTLLIDFSPSYFSDVVATAADQNI